MATQVVMPKLSPTMEEGQLSRWLKKEGDKVSAGEPLAEIDTDKATMEAQALASGVLRKIFVEAGSTVPLGEVIAVIAEADEDISEIVARAQSGKPARRIKRASRRTSKPGRTAHSRNSPRSSRKARARKRLFKNNRSQATLAKTEAVNLQTKQFKLLPADGNYPPRLPRPLINNRRRTAMAHLTGA